MAGFQRKGDLVFRTIEAIGNAIIGISLMMQPMHRMFLLAVGFVLTATEGLDADNR
jgi:hypothetical protein